MFIKMQEMYAVHSAIQCTVHTPAYLNLNYSLNSWVKNKTTIMDLVGVGLTYCHTSYPDRQYSIPVSLHLQIVTIPNIESVASNYSFDKIIWKDIKTKIQFKAV